MKLGQIADRLEVAFKQIKDICVHFIASKQQIINVNNNKKETLKSQKKDYINSNSQKNQKSKAIQPISDQQSSISLKEIIEKKQRKNSSHSNINQKPKQPLTPFFIFSKQNREKVKEEYPDLNLIQVSDILGKIWKQMTNDDKQRYQNEYNHKKKTYQKQLEEYYKQHPEERKPKKAKRKNKNQKIQQKGEQQKIRDFNQSNKQKHQKHSQNLNHETKKQKLSYDIVEENTP